MKIEKAKQMDLLLSVLCHVPVDSDFFEKTTKDVLQLCEPEQRFESAMVADMLDIMAKHGATAEKRAAAEPIMRGVLKNRLTDVFVGHIGRKTKNMNAMGRLFLRIFDTASALFGDEFPRSTRHDLKMLFLQDGTAVTERARAVPTSISTPMSAVNGNSEQRPTPQATASEQINTVPKANEPEVFVQHALPGATVNSVGAVTTPPITLNIAGLNQLIDGLSKDTLAMVSKGTAPTNVATVHQNQENNVGPAANHLVQQSIAQTEKPFTKPSGQAEVASTVQTPQGPTKPSQITVTCKKDVTCWFYYNKRPPCRFRAESCPFAHELLDYVQDRFGHTATAIPKESGLRLSSSNKNMGPNDITPNGSNPQGSVLTKGNSRPVNHGAFSSAGSPQRYRGDILSASRIKVESDAAADDFLSRISYPGTTNVPHTSRSESLTPIMDLFWGINAPIRGGDLENMHRAILTKVQSRMNGRDDVSVAMN